MGLDQNELELVGAGLMGLGLLASLLSLAALLLTDRKTALPGQPGKFEWAPGLDRPWLLILLGALAVGLILRLWALDAKGITHPELYTPGIDLPADMSTPPPRHSLGQTLGYHFFWEPHPFGYYLGKWAWTKVAGTSLFAMRLPEALIGAASVYLTYRVGKLAYGAKVGVVAALILAVHGFHIFWSQMARMYSPGAFIGLAATWLLLELARRERRSPLLEVLYVGTIAAGALTVEFMWPVLAMHMLWTALQHREPENRAPRLAVFQTLALVMASPMLAHALMGAREGATDATTFAFITDYFSLGYLFNVEDAPPLPVWQALLAALATVPLLIIGLFARTDEQQAAAPPAPPPLWPLLVAAVGAGVMIFGIALAAPARKLAIAATAVIPLLALAAPWLIGALGRLRLGERMRSPAAIAPLIAVVPPVLIFLVSYKINLAAERAYVMFIPFLAIVTAAGLMSLWPRKALFAPAALALAAVLALGFATQHAAPSSPRDYKGLAEALNREMKPGDLIFIRSHHWAYSPMFYYVDHKRFVAENFQDAVEQARGSRFWVISFLDEAPEPEMAGALYAYKPSHTIKVLRGSATVYEALAPETPAP